MPTDTARRVVRQLQRLALRETEALTDGQLLECFATQRDEAAFAALVRRHGPMVLGVCRRVAGHAQDAEDAFQATFLVLVRKAAGLRPRELVGHWLHGVAYRTALRARDSAARRRQHESQVPTMPQVQVPPAPVDGDWLPLLDRELQRLPEKYRVPVVLCDLEGRTRREVARQLKLPDGTLSNRLAAGRRLLARRLARHGVALSAGAVAATLLSASSAAVPTRLFLAAVQTAAEDATPAAVPAAVTALSHGVLQAMLLQKLKVTAGVLIALGVLGAATFATLPQSRAEPPPAGATTTGAPDSQRLQGAWLMLAMATDGRMSSAAAIKDEGKRWTFHGDKFLVTRANEPGQVIEAAFKLDATKSPREMVYVPSSGSDEGQTVPAIYWLSDDLLVVADDLGTKQRPGGFRVQGRSGRLMVFAREGSSHRIPDAEFLMRICRDFRGSGPTNLESQYFRDDKDSAKRAKALVWLLGGEAPVEDLTLSLGVTYEKLAFRELARDRLKEAQLPLKLNSNELKGTKDLAVELALEADGSALRTRQHLGALVQDLNGHYLNVAGRGLTEASPAASEDARALRRMMLDLIGRLPTPLEVQYYVADKTAGKRERVIDWLVKSDEHARRAAEQQKSGQGPARAGDDPLGRLLDQLLIDNKSDDQVLEALSLAALARYPSAAEKALAAAQVAKHADRRAAWRDVVATLLHLPDAKQHIDGLNRWREAK